MINYKHSFYLGALTSLFLLVWTSCGQKTETCHKHISVVNNSANPITVRTLDYYYINGKTIVSLCGCVGKEPSIIAPKDILTIDVSRYCLEDEISVGNDDNYSFFILDTSTPCLSTTKDSLDIVYDILKKINLAEVGVDSLIKTDFTIYYP